MPEGAEKRLFIALALLVAILVAGTVMYKVLTGDHYDWMTCLYMTVITLGTVGYGEVIDTSLFPGVRMFTVVLILSGMAIIGYSFSTVTSIMVEMDLGGAFKRRKMNKDISKLRNHFIVCGSGATGTCIVQELLKTATRFVIVERDHARLETLQKLDELLYVEGDATDDDVLLKAGIKHASGLAAALSTEKDNLFLTLTARQLNPSIRIVARGLDENVDQKLRKAGANAVVSPTHIGGLRMASELIRPSVVSFLDTMLRESASTIRFEELHIQAGSRFINHTIKSTKLRDDSNLLVVALKRPDSPGFVYNPSADTVLSEGSTLVLLGESKQIHELRDYSRSTI
ncbi:MAG: potassium channel protein [Candidatus Abyssobacteria bacterium SURF_17]|jgi:voltage-gated potassium channel|uniref:Potassium channel protein n=1 Tax=Candidatus Abyssobacteria bacterium SURF_17 TaxID=2093361 RepID=A0A419ENV9_9BACT|nr:MAG: potassium channel protein [Candidatus Abyssubacteria bacterium SURF_17]